MNHCRKRCRCRENGRTCTQCAPGTCGHCENQEVINLGKRKREKKEETKGDARLKEKPKKLKGEQKKQKGQVENDREEKPEAEKQDIETLNELLESGLKEERGESEREEESNTR